MLAVAEMFIWMHDFDRANDSSRAYLRLKRPTHAALLCSPRLRLLLMTSVSMLKWIFRSTCTGCAVNVGTSARKDGRVSKLRYEECFQFRPLLSAYPLN